MQQASISLRFCFTIIYYGGDTAIYTDRAATRVSANQLIFFWGGVSFADVEIDHLHSLLRRSEMNCKFAI